MPGKQRLLLGLWHAKTKDGPLLCESPARVLTRVLAHTATPNRPTVLCVVLLSSRPTRGKPRRHVVLRITSHGSRLPQTCCSWRRCARLTPSRTGMLHMAVRLLLRLVLLIPGFAWTQVGAVVSECFTPRLDGRHVASICGWTTGCTACSDLVGRILDSRRFVADAVVCQQGAVNVVPIADDILRDGVFVLHHQS